MKRWYVLIVIMLAITTLLPLLVSGLFTFGKEWLYPELLPKEFTLESWWAIFSPRYNLGVSVFNSLLVAILVALFTTGLAFPIVFVVKRYPISDHILVASFFMPPLAVTFGLFRFFLRIGLTGTYVGLILVHILIALPFSIYVLKGSIQSDVLTMGDQSRAMGIGWINRVMHVYMPMMMPSLMYTMTMVFFLSWHQYVPNVVIAGGRIPTITTQFISFVYSGNFPLAGAVAWVFLVPLLGVAFVHRWYFRWVPWLV